MMAFPLFLFPFLTGSVGFASKAGVMQHLCKAIAADKCSTGVSLIEAGVYCVTTRFMTCGCADTRAIFAAATHAQRAADYLHALQPDAQEMTA